MKKAQIKKTQASKEKSGSKTKETKEASQGRSSVSKRNSGIVIPSKAASNANISSVSKAAGKAGYSSVSKERSAGRQAKSDNNISSVVGNRSKTKSPENSKKKDAREDNKKLNLKRRDALKDADVDKIRSLSKNVKKAPEVKISDSSVKTSARGRSNVDNSQSKGKEQKKVTKLSSASKRIKTLAEDTDPKKVAEALDKIKKGSKEPKAAKKSIAGAASKKAAKQEEPEEEVQTESEDEQIDLTKSSNKKKATGPVAKKKQERSRDEKISKEKELKEQKEREKLIKIPDSSNKKSKQSDRDAGSATASNNIKPVPKSTPKQDKNKPQIKEESSQQSKHVVKKSPFTPQKKESSEEASLSEESEKKSKASREKKVLQKAAKQQLPTAIDTSQISDEISKIIKRIEEKRKKVGGASDKRRSAGSKSKNASLTKRDNKSSTAELYGGVLQLNSNIIVEHVIDIKDLQKKDHIVKTEVLLAIIEIAMNSDYYSLSRYNRSKSFWEDVLKYNELKKIFEPLKAETLKKYWININITGDPLQVADFIKKHKKIFDTYKIMVLPMISTAAEYFKKNIDNLEDYIKNIPREPLRAETKFIETVDLKTGKVKTEKKKTLTTYKRARHAEPITRRFTGRNNVNDVDEIIDGTRNLRDVGEDNFNLLLNKIEIEEGYRRDFLMDLKDEEKKRIFSINDEDKFIFKTIEDVVKKLNKVFPNYSDAFILESLKGNSFNIHQTYKYLTDPKTYSNCIFTDLDDEIIRNMRNSEFFDKLCDDKGKNNVYMRIDYLNV